MKNIAYECTRVLYERYFLPLFVGPRRLPEIQKFRNVHKGQECYIFGDGVSVKHFDLKHFGDLPAISCGQLPFHKDFEKLDVRYALCMEPYWFFPYYRFTFHPYRWWKNRMQSAYHELIRSRKNISFFISLTNWPTVRESNVTFVNGGWKYSDLPKSHLGNKRNVFSGSLNAAIFLAIYMGFSKVYLVGFDYTHRPQRIMHWYEYGNGYVADSDGYNSDFFDEAKRYLDIVTVTLGGVADGLQSITYRDLTGAEPVYRENVELLGEDYIRTLATWDDFRMYASDILSRPLPV